MRLRRAIPPSRIRASGRARHVPGFAFEYMDGGAGAGGIARNWRALDAIELVARYGRTPVAIALFGRPYAVPIGIAPHGADPRSSGRGAGRYLAGAAQRARIPYTLGTVGGMTIEAAARTAPDVPWFQLYRFGGDGHRVGFDLVRRDG